MRNNIPDIHTIEETEHTSRSDNRALSNEITWFQMILETRMRLYFNHECDYTGINEIQPPVTSAHEGTFASFVDKYQLNFEERLIVALVLIPHIQPDVLDPFFVKNKTYDRDFTEFGGTTGEIHKGFLPTIETAVFILAGKTTESKADYLKFFSREQKLRKENIIEVGDAQKSSTLFSKTIRLSNQAIQEIFYGEFYEAEVPGNFPARELQSPMDWYDLVLPIETGKQIQEIINWLDYGDTLLNDWGMNKMIKPGFRTLFYGPPGTGKTLTATLIGKRTNRKVLGVDLSQIVSKYIGETEKNLARIFDQAEGKNWILFFDEADSLFGKRTDISSSHDRYANQDIAYLLQRIENYNGVVILASNLKNNLDLAFYRRFQSIIHFPMPTANEREQLWQKAIPPVCDLDNDISIREIGRAHV